MSDEITSQFEDFNIKISIFYSACIGDLGSIIIYLSDENNDVDDVDNQGYSALHWAAIRGQIQVINLLITKYLATIDILSYQNETPLFLSVSSQNIGSIRTLLMYGASLHYTNLNGVSPLHLAVVSSNEDIINELIERGSWLEQEDNEGESPLFYAIREAKPKIVKLLLEKGSLISHYNKDKQTPLLFAHELSSIDSDSEQVYKIISNFQFDLRKSASININTYSNKKLNKNHSDPLQV